MLSKCVLILLQVTFMVADPTKPVNVQLAVGPYAYHTHLLLDDGY